MNAGKFRKLTVAAEINNCGIKFECRQLVYFQELAAANNPINNKKAKWMIVVGMKLNSISLNSDWMVINNEKKRRPD